MVSAIRLVHCKILVLIALAVTSCIPAEAPDEALAGEATIALVNALLIDGVSDQPVPDSTVIVSGGKIVSVGRNDSIDLPPAAKVIDLRGAALLPGLINTHVHFTPNRHPEAALTAMLHLGVTAVRDLSGNGALLTQLSESGAARPNVVYSGTLFGEGFVNDPRLRAGSAPYEAGDAPWMKVITAEDEIANAIDAARRSGVTGIKLYASLDAKTINRITREAHAQGLLVWSHSVVFPAGPEDAVAAGVDELIHSKGLAALGADDIPDTFAKGIPKWMSQRPFATLDPYSEEYQALFAQMRERGIALNPALIADGDVRMRSKPLPARMSAMRDWACNATRAAFEAGVTINSGTDYTGEPGLLFLEIERLTQCGLTPMAAIKAATINAAMALGLGASHGTIEAGKAADLLAIQGNPVLDISEIRNTVLVMKSGRLVQIQSDR